MVRERIWAASINISTPQVWPHSVLKLIYNSTQQRLSATLEYVGGPAQQDEYKTGSNMVVLAEKNFYPDHYDVRLRINGDIRNPGDTQWISVSVCTERKLHSLRTIAFKAVKRMLNSGVLPAGSQQILPAELCSELELL
jgi:hypothetical protein